MLTMKNDLAFFSIAPHVPSMRRVQSIAYYPQPQYVVQQGTVQKTEFMYMGSMI